MSAKFACNIKTGDIILAFTTYLTVESAVQLGDCVEVNVYPPRDEPGPKANHLAAATGAYDCQQVDHRAYRLFYRANDQVGVEPK